MLSISCVVLSDPVNTAVGYRSIDGKTYRVIEESQTFIGILNGVDPDPFLVFRASGNDVIRGYGTKANKAFAEGFREAFVEAGYPRNSITMKFSDSEWNLLETEGQEWAAMRVEAEARFMGAKVQGSFEIQSRLLYTEVVDTEAGEFEALVVEYLHETEVEGEVKRLKLCIMWLCPDVGLVKIRIGRDRVTLDEYHIKPVMPVQEQGVGKFGKLCIAWAHLKRLR